MSRKNWFLRHKILTATGAVLVLGMFSSLAYGGTKSEPVAAIDQAATSEKAAADLAAAELAAAAANQDLAAPPSGFNDPDALAADVMASYNNIEEVKNHSQMQAHETSCIQTDNHSFDCRFVSDSGTWVTAFTVSVDGKTWNWITQPIPFPH